MSSLAPACAIVHLCDNAVISMDLSVEEMGFFIEKSSPELGTRIKGADWGVSGLVVTDLLIILCTVRVKEMRFVCRSGVAGGEWSVGLNFIGLDDHLPR